MNERDRQALATTGVGGTLVALGGHQRFLANTEAVGATGRKNVWKDPAMLRRGVPNGARVRWGGGTALGVVGGTGLAVGASGLVNRKKKPVVKMSSAELRQQKSERTQARVGLASNALGLAAGSAALGEVARRPAFAEGGKVSRGIYRAGTGAGRLVPKPVQRGLVRMGPKKLAAGALTLQAANVAGDVVANRVLARSAKDQSVRKSTPLLYEGLAGTREAFSDRVRNASQPKDPRAVATPYAIGAGAGLGGAQAAHKIIDRAAGGSVKNWGGRHATVAVAGTVAAASSLPLSRRAVNRVSPGYEVTPTGVKRKKTKAIPPSRSANTVEMRANHGARPGVRGQVVPNDPRYGVNKADMDYEGAGMSRREKRARVYAAGAVPGPFIGPINSARAAARIAPPDQRRSAAALQLGGVAGGATLGTAGGAYGTAALVRRSPVANQRILSADDALERGKDRMRSKVDPHLPAKLRNRGGTEGPGRASRAFARVENSGGRAGRTISAAARPLRGAGRAPIVGALAGKHVGALVGGTTGYGWALRREDQRRARIQGGDGAVTKVFRVPPGGYLVQRPGFREEEQRQDRIRGRRATVRKLDASGMTRNEQIAQYKRRKRNVGLAVASTATGAAGVGALALSHGGALPRVGRTIAANKEKIERFGLGTALAGGGVGSVQGAQSIGIQRRDLAAQERRLRIKPEVEKGLFGDLGGAARRANQASHTRAADRILERSHSMPKLTQHEHTVIDGKVWQRYRDSSGEVRTTKAMTQRDSEQEHRLTAQQLTLRGSKPVHTFDAPFSKALLPVRRATFRSSYLRKTPRGPVRIANTVAKIDTSMDTKTAHSYAGKYGTKGPLPKGLERDEKMRAYEGRYIVAGGPKGEKWKRRADTYDHVTGATVAGAIASVGAEEAARSRRGRVAIMRRGGNAARLAHRADRGGKLLAAAGAGSELAHRHAEHRQAKYSNSAAGVAASALRRMRDYTPD